MKRYEMINVIASVNIKEGHLQEFVEIFKANVPKVLEEKGCVDYVPTIDLPTGTPIQELDKNVVTIIEKWESLEALQAHLSAPHMHTYRERVKDFVEKMTVKILQGA